MLSRGCTLVCCTALYSVVQIRTSRAMVKAPRNTRGHFTYAFRTTLVTWLFLIPLPRNPHCGTHRLSARRGLFFSVFEYSTVVCYCTVLLSNKCIRYDVQMVLAVDAQAQNYIHSVPSGSIILGVKIASTNASSASRYVHVCTLSQLSPRTCHLLMIEIYAII